MRYRGFGLTGLRVSEVGFGAWAIGGKSYGAVRREDSLRALARAEELGCNFIDTAEVYGDSESVLGEFLPGRRDRWLVATKYSGQPEGLLATAERQLSRMKLDAIDFYQIHWAPRGHEARLLDDLQSLKQAGKAKSVGVSLSSAGDIDDMLASGRVDGFQVPFSLLEPRPLLSRLPEVRAARPGIIARSSLRSGFLTGKFPRGTVFPDPNDQRGKLKPAEVDSIIERVERFRFLEREAGSLLLAAARYPLSFPEVSTVILGTKNEAQADTNFGAIPGGVLSEASLTAIRSVQRDSGLLSRSAAELVKDVLRSAKRVLRR
jgi:aryl-alcohol dehydrogenase-like predicted oxidoreductase